MNRPCEWCLDYCEGTCPDRRLLLEEDMEGGDWVGLPLEDDWRGLS